MIAVDTNILVCAHRADSPFHDRARSVLESLAAGARQWAVPWPCAHEFFAVVTNHRIYKTATSAETAFAQLRALHSLANLALAAEKASCAAIGSGFGNIVACTSPSSARSRMSRRLPSDPKYVK